MVDGHFELDGSIGELVVLKRGSGLLFESAVEVDALFIFVGDKANIVFAFPKLRLKRNRLRFCGVGARCCEKQSCYC